MVMRDKRAQRAAPLRNAIIGIIMAGCATCPPQIAPARPEVVLPPRPELPTATLRPTDPPDVVQRALIESLAAVMGYARECEMVVNP